jgi:hypothetical protein
MESEHHGTSPLCCAYQSNTSVWLTELWRALRRLATLDDMPDADLDCLVQMGFDRVWVLSVWLTGLAGQQVARCQRW